MKDQRGSVGVEERGGSAPERHQLGDILQAPGPVRPHVHVRQVTGVWAFLTLQPMLLSLWVEVSGSGGEAGRLALAHGVDVEAVLAGGTPMTWAMILTPLASSQKLAVPTTSPLAFLISAVAWGLRTAWSRTRKAIRLIDALSR